MNDFVIKIAKPGKNVSSVDMRNFSLHSEVNMLKVHLEGHITVSVNSLAAPLDAFPITHDLGYDPLVFAYFRHPEIDRWFKIPGGGGATLGGTWSLFGAVMYVDPDDSYNPSDNKLTILLYDDVTYPMPTSPQSIDLKYYIFADPAEDPWFEPATSDTDDGSPEQDFVLKISRPGIDVRTAEKKNLVFDSTLSTLKVCKVMHFTGAGQAPHGVGHTPTFLGMMEDPDNAGSYISTDFGVMGESGVSKVSVDSGNVYYSGTEEAYVILFVDPLDE